MRGFFYINMAAPIGNQFWKMRSKVGRDRLFASPDDMWDAAAEYFNWCDSHPWWRNEGVKSGEKAGQIMKIPIARPYTIQGLTNYLNCNVQYFSDFEKSIKGKTDEQSIAFSIVVTRIREAIYQQKFEGAAVGAFNANIIARDLGLADKTINDTTIKGAKVIIEEIGNDGGDSQ